MPGAGGEPETVLLVMLGGITFTEVGVGGRPALHVSTYCCLLAFRWAVVLLQHGQDCRPSPFCR
jgi:hypothetical protein